ncbi:Zn-dependent membrane protease YugP [Ensifer adhaerens]|uniref:Zn-dependent membrane protease YugP n=1 Tax=Ensifer adhaerens TaxID=106592 RepID=A0ACC5SY11_ENSAD|nr:Zn-dependent membrane protease YugP [Ensifer adhaerens]
MSLRNARIQIALGWVLVIVGALLGVNLMADIGLVIWGIGLILQIVASVIYLASKTGGGRLGGA